MSQSPYATSLLREGAQGLIGGSLTWLLTCAFAGAVATAATANSVKDFIDDFTWSWMFAWVLHLAVAGIELWGLVIICIQAWCVSALVHGTERVLRVVVVAFIAQLTTSAIVIVIGQHEYFHRMMILWLPFAALSMIYLIGSFVKGVKQ